MADTLAPPATRPRTGVLVALLEFEQAPGRYAVARREPAVLFDHLDTVLRLASDRPADGLGAEAASALHVRRAARFFVRSVMLRPGADHYTVLGLTGTSPPETRRYHYRMMMRLVHPDFSRADEAWPADAATRINLANDVLSSPERRQRYDASRARAPSPAQAPARDTPRPRPAKGPLARLLTWRRALVAVAVLLLAGLVWLFTRPDHPGASLRVKRAVLATPMQRVVRP